MANFGLLDKPYIKLGTSSDVCYCCLKSTCERERRDVYDVTNELKGRIEDKQVFYIRRSGQDTCICFDCFKEIYEDIIKMEMPVVEEALTEQVTEETTETTTDASPETTKKSSTKKK